ncbi:hypothetical protein H6P81_008824 [Aristolochia fimbriata]|uniref:Uncharacterized protein n=1 Tax=Aristolochia fimbriata TaxID=158543 RepID=A0AAV7EJG7_ARIFI|nr:hypothetical protein H6P81_008824 [Aristolochia fimbriata]
MTGPRDPNQTGKSGQASLHVGRSWSSLSISGGPGEHDTQAGPTRRDPIFDLWTLIGQERDSGYIRNWQHSRLSPPAVPLRDSLQRKIQIHPAPRSRLQRPGQIRRCLKKQANGADPTPSPRIFDSTASVDFPTWVHLAIKSDLLISALNSEAVGEQEWDRRCGVDVGHGRETAGPTSADEWRGLREATCCDSWVQ